jgi:hypothetical protein
MAKPTNNIQIERGEDQFLLGYNDAEKLENELEGTAEAFAQSSFFQMFHNQYIAGFFSYLKNKK